MRSTQKLPELLAPAGSPEALRAAIEAGADAVYFGYSSFSNRMRAQNFGEKELSDAVALCSVYGVKSYITLNTRVFDREMDEISRICRMDGIKNADALIVADLGVAARVREILPYMALHASTQMTGITPCDAGVLQKLGFERMVCPRELSFGEICKLVEKSPVEIEMFVHGAHCVSFSGQCLMSFAMGGRSPNRGECAQPCRLPYSVETGDGAYRQNTGRKAPYDNIHRCGRVISDMPDNGGYPLSLKDMCLAEHIPEIIKSGVSSLKIEGRLKGAEYVYGVTKIYRRLLDEKRCAGKDETDELLRLFSRSGFTDGYFTGNYANMSGIRKKDDESAVFSGQSKPSLTRKISLNASVSIKKDKPARLTLSDGVKETTVFSEIPAAAKTCPIDRDDIIKGISRLGNTPFVIKENDIKTDIDPGLWMTVAQINDLRRRAVEALISAHTSKERSVCSKNSAPSTPLFEKRKSAQCELKTAEFSDISQISESALCYFDRIFLPASQLKRLFSSGRNEDGRTGADRALIKSSAKLGLAAPPVSFDDREFYETARGLYESGIRSALVNTASELDIAQKLGFQIFASLRFNVTNTLAAHELHRLGAEHVTASPEMQLPSLGGLKESAGAVVYGKLPLMLTSRCVAYHGLCTHGNCRMGKKISGDAERFYLKDRKGVKFPISAQDGCMNIIYNAYPVWMADKMESVEKAQLSFHHYIFTTESADEVSRVVKAYRDREGAPPSGIRRI